uniref:(northern house mosquito) hypothetical protein n=1 Tax=Culex pipiens TaxID=7175 RepID=A0A8D8MS53_CULPI
MPQEAGPAAPADPREEPSAANVPERAMAWVGMGPEQQQEQLQQQGKMHEQPTGKVRKRIRQGIPVVRRMVGRLAPAPVDILGILGRNQVERSREVRMLAELPVGQTVPAVQTDQTEILARPRRRSR